MTAIVDYLSIVVLIYTTGMTLLEFTTAFTSARHLFVPWTSLIQSIPPHPTSWRSILILSSHLRLSLPSGLFPLGFPTKTLNTPLLSPIYVILTRIFFLLKRKMHLQNVRIKEARIELLSSLLGTRGGVELQIQVFLASSLEWRQWLGSSASCFTPRNTATITVPIGTGVGPTACLDPAESTGIFASAGKQTAVL